MTRLRLGVVGYGNRGVIAPRAAADDGSADLVAVVEPSAAGRRRVARDLSGATLHLADTVSEILDDDLDAVFITSPDDQHAEQAIALLEHG
ncbi:MAG TPA: Gfo/Idh/MocA family oxidoreductase, partial [Microlunatus sp.]